MLRFGSPVARPSAVTSGWSEGRPVSVGSVHQGIDFRAPVGSPVFAVAGGIVQFAQTGSETAGNWIGIRHAGDFLTRYLHLSQLAVRAGQQVVRGQLIGLSGNTGLSTGPHLHFDVIAQTPAALREYVSFYGTPAGGFTRGDLGTKVPAEPLVPADSYSARTVAAAREWKIPLYADTQRQPAGVFLAFLSVISPAVLFLRPRG